MYQICQHNSKYLLCKDHSENAILLHEIAAFQYPHGSIHRNLRVSRYIIVYRRGNETLSNSVKNFQFVGCEIDDSDCDDTETNYAKDTQDINPLTVLQILNPCCGINFHHCFIRKI